MIFFFVKKVYFFVSLAEKILFIGIKSLDKPHIGVYTLKQKKYERVFCFS